MQTIPQQGRDAPGSLDAPGDQRRRDKRSSRSARRRRPRPFLPALIVTIAAAVASLSTAGNHGNAQMPAPAATAGASATPGASPPAGPAISGSTTNGPAAACPPRSRLPPGQLVTLSPPCQAADFAFRDSNGATLRLGDLRGKWLLVNLWATWCPPCVREMPHLDALQESFGPMLTVATINQDAGAVDVAGWLSSRNLTHLPAWHDRPMMASRAFASDTLPLSVLIDPQGRERARLSGGVAWNSPAMKQALTSLMRQPDAP